MRGTDRAARRRPGTPRARARPGSRAGGERPCAPVAPRRGRRAARARTALSPRARRATWPTCGGSNAPPKSATSAIRASRRRAPPRRLRAHRPPSGSPRARRRGRAARDAEAALGAEHAERAARRLRPVDEVVDELARRGASGTISSGGTSSKSARLSSSTPAPVAADTRNTRTIRSSSIANSGGSGLRSVLFSTITCGRSSRPAPYAASSVSIVRHRSSASPSDASITCSSSRARSRCARNSWPRPTPSLAPSIRPGHVGDDELPPLGRLDRAEHRRERRERDTRRPSAARSRCARGATTCPRSAGRRAPRRRAA